MSPNFSDNTNMDTIDFKKLSEQLRSELLRVNGWRKVVRTGSIAVYLFVFCWFMFVLFGGALVSYIGLENYMQFTQYIIPVFIGFIVVNFVFTRCMANFQERESEAMQHIMSTLFPTVYFSASSQVDSRILRDSKLFSASFSDPALAVWIYPVSARRALFACGGYRRVLRAVEQVAVQSCIGIFCHDLPFCASSAVCFAAG